MMDFLDGLCIVEPRTYVPRSQRLIIRELSDKDFLNFDPAKMAYTGTSPYDLSRFVNTSAVSSSRRVSGSPVTSSFIGTLGG